MGNVVDSAGGAVDDLRVTAFTNSQDELVMSLRSFVFLYDQHERRLQKATRSFTQAAARLQNVSSPCHSFSFLGGAVGGACGGVAGVVGGSLGAVAAATCGKLCGRINAVGAAVGLFGSVLGGAAGGVFSGAVGGAVGVVVTPLGGDDDDRAVNKAVWFAVGVVTGGAIGGIFGGTVGAAGGAVGGGFGALCGTGAAFSLTGSSERDSKMKTMQNAADELRASLDPLAQQLRIIDDTVSADESTSGSGDREKRVAAQASRTLVAVTTAQRLTSDCRRAAGRLREFVAEAAKRSSEITEMLRGMRSEAEKLLTSLEEKN